MSATKCRVKIVLSKQIGEQGVKELKMLTLRQIRMMRGYTVREAAKLFGVHENTLRLWEKNPSKITMGNATRIAMTYRYSFVDIDWEHSVRECEFGVGEMRGNEEINNYMAQIS